MQILTRQDGHFRRTRMQACDKLCAHPHEMDGDAVKHLAVRALIAGVVNLQQRARNYLACNPASVLAHRSRTKSAIVYFV